MADGMAEIKRFTDSLFFGVFTDNAFFNGYRSLNQRVQRFYVDLPPLYLEREKAVQMVLIADQSMLKHLGKAGEDIVTVERTQEDRIDQHRIRRVERSDLVLQPVEVNARFPAHSRIDGGHKRRRDIERMQSAFERCPREPAEVGHHPTAEVYQQRMAGCSALREDRPNSGNLFDVFMRIPGRDRDDLRLPERLHGLQKRQTSITRIRIGQDICPVVFMRRKIRYQLSRNIFCDKHHRLFQTGFFKDGFYGCVQTVFLFAAGRGEMRLSAATALNVFGAAFNES